MKKTGFKRTAQGMMRKFLFILMSVILCWPIWILLRLVRPFHFFDYLFLVYPGTDSDLDGYCPRKLAKNFLSGKPAIGGIIAKGAGGRGLVLVIPNTVAQFRSNKELCEVVVKRLTMINEFVGAKAIAIAGQLPSIINHHGIELRRPFVKGNKGTVYCVMQTVEDVVRINGLDKDNTKVVVVGVGYVGTLLMDAMRADGYDISGVDTRFNRNRSDVILPEHSKSALGDADVVIVLTPKGSDFEPYFESLKPGAIIIDDTHPKIIRNHRHSGFKIYKVAMGLPMTVFRPRLPGYKANWIPGCALEAIISSATDTFNSMPQNLFNSRAKTLGFFSHLID